MVQTRSRLVPFMIAALLAACSGCHVLSPVSDCDVYVAPDVPRELAKVSMPEYLIEPPDILDIEAINITPHSPYFLRSFDVLSIDSNSLPEELTLVGDFPIQPNGTIQLGNGFGAVEAAGKTTSEVEADILELLRDMYRDPQVWVTITSMAAQQQISGEHLVAPDGRVTLGTYGRVKVVGLTIEEAKAAIEQHLGAELQAPEVAVDVLGFNSKVYYVITQGAGLGDQVSILPIRGNETVLDAIGQIQGLESNSSTRMWVARPGPNSEGGDQILPVDWLAVTQRGDIATNYQLLPGDRLYVSEDKLVALDTALAKLISPFERVFGVTLLGTQTAQRVGFFKETAINNNNGNF